MRFGINTATAMCGCLAGKRRKILMKEFCDVFSDLIERSGIKQKEIAEILDVIPTSISNQACITV